MNSYSFNSLRRRVIGSKRPHALHRRFICFQLNKVALLLITTIQNIIKKYKKIIQFVFKAKHQSYPTFTSLQLGKETTYAYTLKFKKDGTLFLSHRAVL